MKRQASVKVIVDLLMTVLLMLLMAFELIGRPMSGSGQPCLSHL